MAEADPFMTEIYDRLHDTPMQRKFRKIAPVPVGVVFIEWPGMTEDDFRRHFRLMKELGFTCLKGTMLLPGTDKRKFMHAALDEGIIPWWYGEGGWEAITDELFTKLGIPVGTSVPEIRKNEKFLAHQEEVFRARIDRPVERVPDATAASLKEIGGMPFTFDTALHEKQVVPFVEWLKDLYGTVEALVDAWNLVRLGAGGKVPLWRTWEDVERGVPDLGPREYRHLRDILRFKADTLLGKIRAKVDGALARDPDEPLRDGGEMGLFLPFAARATDMEGTARIMADGGSFYPSIHLAWHFEEIDFEVTRPVYMQASLAADWFKGGWSATWESTGGPQQLSGAKAHLFPEAAKKVAGFTVDEGVITQLMLSYLAAGFRGFGFWCWNPRTFGWEAGEYGLLDRQLNPTERAVRAGRIGQAARRYRDELWRAHKEPMVGVFVDFDAEAMWAAMAVQGRDFFRRMPVFARIGASRALINANVPWEYVTARNLEAGLGGRYRVIYMPAVIALDAKLMEILHAYVASGGRLVVDMPSAWYDEYGRLLLTGEGTAFERIFGCMIRDFQYSSNVPRKLGDETLSGFVVDLALTRAKALVEFDNGLPAATEARCGDGTAVVLGYEASLLCRRPGNMWAEAKLVEHALGGVKPPYSCDGAIVYRLAAPDADHYFFINDGPSTSVTLDTGSFDYKGTVDAVTREKLEPDAEISLDAYSGRWVRFQR